MKYIDFFDGDRLIDKSDPIYKQRRKKNLGIKIGEIIDKYSNGVPQTKILQTKSIPVNTEKRTIKNVLKKYLLG